MPSVHISAKDLRPGMFIVATESSWHDRPYLYSKVGLIKSQAEIDAILANGYVEAYYDPDRSFERPPNFSASSDLLVSQAQIKPPKATVPLVEEIKTAQVTYSDCLLHIKQMLSEARHGTVDLPKSKKLVSNLVESLTRNQDALAVISKIKTFDDYTYAHSINVAIFSIAFGLTLGLTGEVLSRLGQAAIFHDFGKMRIPKWILNAPRALKPEELAIVQNHPRLGAEMLEGVPALPKEIIDGVLDHHEKYDGTGYPNRKKGSEISPFGRIISVADVYDALSTKRIYREAISPNKALATMYSIRDQSWEPGLCETFIKMLGIYPVGSGVSLTMGYKGIVSESNYNAPLYPTVLLYCAPNGTTLKPPQAIDLSTQHDLQIVKALPPNALNISLTDLL